MNISPISANIQQAKVQNTVKFTGINKAAAQLANSDVLEKTANKVSKGGQGVFFKAFNALKNAAVGAFSAVKNTAAKVFKTISKGIHTAFDAVKSAGKKAVKTVSDIFSGKKDKTKTAAGISKTSINVTANNGLTVNKVTFGTKDGNIIIDGKVYKYDGELPEGIKINKKGGISIHNAGSIESLVHKMQDFAKLVQEKGELIG